MKRRSLTGILTFALSTRWRQAAGQSPAPRIGYLWLGAPGSDETTKSGLLKGLEELGYSDGRTISIDYRYADGNEARLAPLLAELIAARPALLVTPGVVATRAAMNTTKTVPIVSAAADPVGSGFAISLARPGRNITGVAITAGAEVAAKWVEFARELVPNATRIALLLNPSSSASATYVQNIRSLAGPLGLVLTFHGVTDRQELAGALDSIAAANPQVLIVDADALLSANHQAIVAFANGKRIPAVYAMREFVDSGGLMSYGASIFESWRYAAKHVDQILKGAKPADLPIEQPTKFELIINLKTARSLGIAISPLLLARADEVIE
jgi:putative ABC transport system substrate-binding protein